MEAMHSTLRFRIATEANIPALVELVNAAYRIETFLEGTRTDAARLGSMMQKGEILLGEDEADTLVGCVYMEPRGHHGYLGMFAVDPARQVPPQPDYPDPEHFGWQKRYALTSSRFGAAPAEPTHDNWGPIVVPANHFFMMGDNRYDSKDSRYWGFVPRENVRGRPMFVYYSYNADDSDRPLPFITDIRWSRLGHWIK